MRLAICRREYTFFWTTLLFILSFSLPFTHSAEVHPWIHHHRLKRVAPTSFNPTPVNKVLAIVDQGNPSGVSAVSDPALSIPFTTPTLLPSLFTSISVAVPSPTSVATSSSSSSPSPPEPTLTSTSTSTPPTTHAESTSTPPSTAATPSISSTPTTTTSSSTVASTSSSPPVAIVPNASPSPTATTFIAGAGNSSPESFTSASTGPSPTSTKSSSGFFSSTGAVAGTFTVVGLVGVAGVIGVGMLVARRRHSSGSEEDMEYLDKGSEPSVDPPMREMGAHSPPIVEDESMTDAGHYAGPPMPLTTPPVVYYSDYDYSGADTQAYPVANPQYGYTVSGVQGYTQGYPAVYAQDYATHNMYSPQDYGVTFTPQAAHVDSGMPNPDEFTDVELDPAPVSSTAAAIPSALRPSVRSTPTPPHQPADPHYSIDSFYTGIVIDTPGEAL
ncbi:hypothetical protein BS17DRAFT_775927 [Gyrodon lividus]|nr:hypothetical protein BS17DRAFT_775927 [Gyrodon lividus]